MKLAALILFAALASGAELRFVPDGRPLQLEIEKAGLYSGKKHLFEFPAYSGMIQFDAAHPEATSVALEIKAGTFKVLDDWINEKDRQKIAEFARSVAMLDAAKHPELVFRSTGARQTGEDTYRVPGDLSIRGITQPVILQVELRRGAGNLIIKGHTSFPMTQFGLKPPSAALNTIRTKDLLTLRFEVLAK
jgi:polyisoprenoid-binding protein YceI